MIPARWQNQEEALQFSLTHDSCMLNMDMGTGKTRVAIDAFMLRADVRRVLIVCPKAVVPVWRTNLEKFGPPGAWLCWDNAKGSVAAKCSDLQGWMKSKGKYWNKCIVVLNYDAVWRSPMGDYILRLGFDMVILDESHRAKAAGSKVSKYLAMLGKRVKYKMCLSGTPMANSPLDIYGQYRFLDQRIFGTNHNAFLQEYAIMGGPERRFVVGFKNQKVLNEKFNSIAYTCKMSDVADRIKLPESLPPVVRSVSLPAKDTKLLKSLNKEFVAECSSGYVVVGNVLTKMVRMQQISSGFCLTVPDPGVDPEVSEMNTSKQDALVELLRDISSKSSVVVFCNFRHDLDAVARSAEEAGRGHYELSGRANELEEWKSHPGAVMIVQIRAGAEGVDMTMANHAIYYSLPHSLALYSQSKARLYRPGQTNPVSFIHLIAEGTIDESIYRSLERKKDVIEAIKDGTFDCGFIK